MELNILEFLEEQLPENMATIFNVDEVDVKSLNEDTTRLFIETVLREALVKIASAGIPVSKYYVSAYHEDRGVFILNAQRQIAFISSILERSTAEKEK